MCLAVPGRVLSVTGETPTRVGRVDFGGAVREVSLDFVPEAQIGNYVLVHVGFAISVLEENEALQTFALMREMGDLLEAEIGDAREEGR